MTEKEYYKWAKKYYKAFKKHCKRECGVIKGLSGDMCIICLESHQREIDEMKAKVELNNKVENK